MGKILFRLSIFRDPSGLIRLRGAVPRTEKNFDHLFKKFQDSIIVISYGDSGNPSIKKIKDLLLQYKKNVRVKKTEYKYKLNRNGHKMFEVLVIGK